MKKTEKKKIHGKWWRNVRMKKSWNESKICEKWKKICWKCRNWAHIKSCDIIRFGYSVHIYFVYSIQIKKY
jgi:hypothetical protein